MTRYVYSDHAVERMLQRDISPDIIMQVSKTPDGRIRQSMDKVILFKKIKGRSDNMIAVVLVAKFDVIEIITVMNYFQERP